MTASQFAPGKTTTPNFMRLWLPAGFAEVPVYHTLAALQLPSRHDLSRSYNYFLAVAGSGGALGRDGAACITPSRPRTFTKPELEGTMYFVLCASVLLRTSRRRIISARSLKKFSAAVETRRTASASALARVMRACASPSALRIS